MIGLGWALAVKIIKLVLPAALGAILAWRGRPKNPEKALAGLNVYALYLAFPALVIRGLMDAQVGLPNQVGFYLLWPLTLMLSLFLVRRLVKTQSAGVLALTLAFGNVAYLGLPYVLALAGSSVKGMATLAVSMHVVGAVTVGPWFYMRWASSQQKSFLGNVRQLFKQPLFWAPILGCGLRWTSVGFRTEVDGWLRPFGESAAVVALFMLGLYLYSQRKHFAKMTSVLCWSMAMRLMIVPMIVLVLAKVLVWVSWLTPEQGQVHVMLGAMPVAITTFAIAADMNEATQDVATLIVWSTAVSMVTLPIWWLIVVAVF